MMWLIVRHKYITYQSQQEILICDWPKVNGEWFSYFILPTFCLRTAQDLHDVLRGVTIWPNHFHFLLGVHLRIKHGEWEVTDGTICHSESELTDSLEIMKSTANQQNQNSIASKIVKEKQVKLKGKSHFTS